MKWAQHAVLFSHTWWWHLKIKRTPSHGKHTETEWRIYASVKHTNIGSDNGLSPGRRQAIIWANAGILLIGPLETNFSEILIETCTFSFKKMHLKMLSGKWRPFCLGLNVLKVATTYETYPHPHIQSSVWELRVTNLLLCIFVDVIESNDVYHQTSSVSNTKTPNLNVSRLVLQLSLPNPLKPGVKSWVKM